LISAGQKGKAEPALAIAYIYVLCASNSNILSMEISKEILNDIADGVEAGFKCFVHEDTHEIVT
jgi:hypothetical protein